MTRSFARPLDLCAHTHYEKQHQVIKRRCVKTNQEAGVNSADDESVCKRTHSSHSLGFALIKQAAEAAARHLSGAHPGAAAEQGKAQPETRNGLPRTSHKENADIISFGF